MKKSVLILSAITLTLFLTGCEESNNLFNNKDVDGPDMNIEQSQVTIAEEEVENMKSAESVECDVNTIGFAAEFMKPGMGLGIGNGPALNAYKKFMSQNFPSCVDVSIEGEDFPKTITLNYADGCEDRHGLARKGIVTIYISDTLSKEGAILTISQDSLVIGKRTIEKSSTFTNMGVNEDGNQVFTIDKTSTTVFEKNDTTTFIIVRDFTGTRTWLAGYETRYASDNIFLREGSGTITVNDEYVFTKTITDPILIDRACRFPLSGVVEITRNDETMSIDYGDGECDNIAVVTKDGESEEIELLTGKFRKGFERHERNMTQKKGWW